MRTLTTEQSNSASAHIDAMSSVEMLRLINAEDANVAIAVKSAIPQIARAVDAITQALKKGGRLIYLGAGTSGRLGILDAVECVPTFGTSPETVQGIIAGGNDALVRSIEGAEDSPTQGEKDLRERGLTKTDVVCGIAASGRTPYVIGALRYAKSVGATSIAISCNLDAPMLGLAEIGIAVDVGPEVIAGSTRMKAGSAQKMILNMLSAATMIQLGKVYGNLMVDLRITNQKLLDRGLRLVAALSGVNEQQAEKLLDAADRDVKTAVVMGRLGISVVEARERLRRADGYLYRVIGRMD